MIIHLQGQQLVAYKQSGNLRYVLSRANIERTMFTGWVEMNKICEEARRYTYVKFPIHFFWDNDAKVWRKRLLNLIQGSQSYDELKTFCGEIKESFKAACYARGLLDNNKEWQNAIDEAYQWATPFQLRHLFVLLLIYCEVANPLRLWEHT